MIVPGMSKLYLARMPMEFLFAFPGAQSRLATSVGLAMEMYIHGLG